MAKAMGAGFATEIRGKVGGIVFGVWRGFATVRAKHAPAQPRSQKQLLVRSIATMLSRKWQSLTNQDDWRTYAEDHTETDWTNTPKRLTGANWYVRLNTRLALFTADLIDAPPSIPAPDPIIGLVATGGSGTIVVTWDSPTTALPLVEIWLDGPRSPGRLPNLVKAKLNSYNAGNTSGVSLTISQPGQYNVYARCFDRLTGLVSQYLVATATVS